MIYQDTILENIDTRYMEEKQADAYISNITNLYYDSITPVGKYQARVEAEKFSQTAIDMEERYKQDYPLKYFVGNISRSALTRFLHGTIDMVKG